MKKLFLTLCLCVMAVCASAQKFTVWYGMNLASVDLAGYSPDSKMKFLNFGLEYAAPFADTFDWGAGVSYMTKGFDGWDPGFIQLYQQFRPRSFEIVSVSLDDNRFAWDRAIEQDGILIWPNGSDLRGMDSPVAKIYMVGSTLPYTVLIDDEGKIVAKGLLGDDLRKAVSDLTKKNKKNK